MTVRTGRQFILGAAGHVDHGKTALITALTGTNTDRLKEEQERGISIELGFAEFPLTDEIVLGVVDMPGHERFVKQMVAGAGGVDLAFLVVAADEGVMPQTVEHLNILDSLGVTGGVVVLSKIDLVDEDIAAVAAEEVRDLIDGTFLADKPIVPVSAITGEGLEKLRRALVEQAESLPRRTTDGPFRLPVDRVFTLPGIGAIVTGTCWSGAVSVGDRLLVEPAGLKVRVREVQAHGRAVPSGGSGQRLALAVHGAKKEDLERGDQIVTPGSCVNTRRFDLRLDLFDRYRGVVKNRQRLHVHHAGREVLGRIVLLDEHQLGGDDGPRTGLAQLHLEDALVARVGDQLVLRFYSPVTSIAGGRILRVQSRRHKRFEAAVLEALAVAEEGDPEALLLQTLREAGLAGLTADHTKGLGEHAEAVPVGSRVYHRGILDAASATIADLAASHLQKHPLRGGISKEEVRQRLGYSGSGSDWNALCEALSRDGAWRVAGDRLTVTGEQAGMPEPLADAVQRRDEGMRQLGLQWPGSVAFHEEHGVPGGYDFKEEDFLKHLVDRGRAVQVAADYYIHAESLAGVIDKLRDHFREQQEMSFAQFRELVGLTRKLGIPLLEYLDQTEATSRVGDSRRAGPRLEDER